MGETILVGSPEHRARQRKLVSLRISQAKEELSGVEFSEDQLSMLCMAFDMIEVAIKDSIG